MSHFFQLKKFSYFWSRLLWIWDEIGKIKVLKIPELDEVLKIISKLHNYNGFQIEIVQKYQYNNQNSCVRIILIV